MATVISVHGGGHWDDPQMWEGGQVPGPDDDVIFKGSQGSTITVARPIDCRTFTFA